MKLEGAHVLVIGAGRSGLGAAQLLLKVGARTVIFDENTGLDIENIRSKIHDGQALSFCLGELTEAVIGQIELAVISPGVPCDGSAAQKLRIHHIPIWSEVELAWRTTRGRVLAITGTNGKTTTTALLGKIMEDALPEDSVFIVGNIGTAWTSRSLETDENSVTVAEISSFQLETIDTFRPSVSAILNITPDHLNRHHTMTEYIRVKELITKNQTPEDTVILNYEDEVLRDFGIECTPRVIWFSSERELEEGLFLRDGVIILRTGGRELPMVETGRLKILGRHNHENVMAAAAMAYAAGVDPDRIRESCEAFTAVPHRIEYVTEKKGVVYYNDSKGTNPDAAIKGIQAMNRPTWLIGGGYDKQSDYTGWIRSFDGKVRGLVLIGQTREKIAEAARSCGFTDIILCEDLKEAVSVCARQAREGEAVLLSPACASWGQFDNYEQRGDVFKKLVHEL